MKKLFALLLALAMVFCLAACGESKGSKDTTTEPTTEPTEEVTTAPTEEPTDATTEPVTEPENAMPAFDPAAAGDLFGKWALTFEMTGAAMGLDDFNGSLAFVIYLTFNEDGSYIASVDEEAREDFVKVRSMCLLAQNRRIVQHGSDGLQLFFIVAMVTEGKDNALAAPVAPGERHIHPHPRHSLILQFCRDKVIIGPVNPVCCGGNRNFCYTYGHGRFSLGQ